jgi:SpoVK/Ycf46/Vps4 family AAA+-type ATPase
MDDSVFIITTNYYHKLDKAFTRAGRFDITMELKKSNYEQIVDIYRDFLGRDIPSSLLNRIEEYQHSPATIIYHLKEYLFKKHLSDEEILENFLTTKEDLKKNMLEVLKKK